MSFKNNKHLLTMVMIFTLSATSYSQLKTHQIGRLWQTMFPVGSLPAYSPLYTSMSYPGGDFFVGKQKNLQSVGLWIGLKDWIDKFGTPKPNYVSEGGYLNFEAPDILEPISGGKYVRQRLPLVAVSNAQEERILDNRGSSIRRTSLDADEHIRHIWATDAGIEVTRNSYAFANRRHDGYIVQEFIFKNTGNTNADSDIELDGQNLTGVYFGFWRVINPSMDTGHEAMGGEHDTWCHYYGNQPGDSLRGFWYAYDGDNQRKPFDDIGDPSETNGEFLATQYAGFGVLHADNSYDDESDDLNQPATVNFWPASQVHSHVKGDPDNILYADLSSGIQSTGSDDGQYTNAWDPQIQNPQLLISFGPYDIPFGEEIRIVIYEAVGSIDRELAIDYGLKWYRGNLEWNGLSGDEAKNALIATGQDSLYKVVKAAEWAWENGLQSVPDGPESPNLRINAGPAKVELEWYYGTYGAHDTIPPKPDVDTDVYDFSGYRLYRTEDAYINPYRVIFECGGNSGIPVTNKYVDRNVNRGKNYFYYVTAFDDGSQNTSELYPGLEVESSHYSNRNSQFAAVPYQGAQPTLDSVYVVPNPFHYQGLAYGGSMSSGYNFNPNIGARNEDQITFVGLPAKAIIRIFSGHGNLVKTLYHPNPESRSSVPESADEAWFQISDSFQTIKSGVYFYHVEGWDRNGNHVGTTKGKFIIIR